MKHRREVNIYPLIHKVRHGYKILLAIGELFPPQYRLAASILGLGMGVSSLYMVLREGKLSSFQLSWGTQQDDSSKIVYVAGLRNLGNNCFLNVVLQALASCSWFVRFLQNVPVSDVESIVECMPLLASLATLLEDLCIIHDEKTILDPRRLMLALSFYANGFALTKQQDAAEALLHLLSSLEEEILHSYMLHRSSLAEIMSIPSRIHKLNSKTQTDLELWRTFVCGPFDGAIRSTLTCRSCSTVLLWDIEHFLSLPLAPVLDSNGDIIEGCSVIDCLKKFTTAEYLENYHCDRCWHIAAIKCLSLTSNNNGEKLDKLKHCVNLGCCDCKNLLDQQEIKWSGFSCVLKQLSITRCPKILCIHLQRASMNDYGELIKLQGHVSFPFILDLFPFTRTSKTLGDGALVPCTRENANRKLQPLDPQLMQMYIQYKKQSLELVHGTAGEDSLLKGIPTNNFKNRTNELPHGMSGEMIAIGKHNVSDKKTEIAAVASDSQALSGIKGSEAITGSYYRLSSVVEHYGKSGSGHYAIFRRVTSESFGGNSNSTPETEQSQWFYVSDHEVLNVSIETVFAAEASLLFYERIDGNFHIAA
ncbi:ubiquitin carboxyl-terminal hydrolase 27-like isoform X1 [Zingiber officinale]|uniref:ubiquitin carboxyl-terminal hydrolase 27-like isoform X1 n=1 Tax=Zingiber officinale TaxID=94328 RepID=UPI001C4B8440|nr:ubiquitin carboxyl-terminal hydrolase 27-like isoform X1 [Zingiber officinale]XP_042411488.1 ubiquitin carboxyl-terminal hydrolase 27-like isoform X1 [Zingiber officinale]